MAAVQASGRKAELAMVEANRAPIPGVPNLRDREGESERVSRDWPWLSFLDAHYVDSQHLTGKSMVDNPGNDLLSIRAVLGIVYFPIVSIDDLYGDTCTRRNRNALLEIFLVDDVTDGGIVIQPISMFGA